MERVEPRKRTLSNLHVTAAVYRFKFKRKQFD